VTATVEHSASTARRYAIAAALPVVCAGLIVSALLVFVAGPVGLILGLVFTVVASILRTRRFGIGVELEILQGLQLRDASGDDAAGLRNLTEALSATAGVPMPSLHVLEAKSCNSMVVGRTPETSALVVTSGLLNDASRIELEAVVARALVQIRQGDLVGATMAIKLGRSALTRVAASFLGALRTLEDPDRDVLLDRAAVRLTRFPPGLIGALETCLSAGTAIRSADPATIHLWMVDPAGGDAVTTQLEHRIEALRLL